MAVLEETGAGAGREMDPRAALDLAVALAVFGWEEVTEDEEQPDQVPYYVDPNPEGHGILYPKVAAKFPTVYPAVGLPPYSTDWNAAALVIEHLRDHGAGELRLESHGWRWVASFSGTGRPGEWGKTGPEAICRAALAIADARPADRG